jgi:hypothetical protein
VTKSKTEAERLRAHARRSLEFADAIADQEAARALKAYAAELLERHMPSSERTRTEFALLPTRDHLRDSLGDGSCRCIRPCQSITPSAEGVRPHLSVGSGRVFLGERQPELLLVLDEARQLCAEEWLKLRAGFLKSLLQLRIVENLAQAVAQDTHDRLRRP